MNQDDVLAKLKKDVRAILTSSALGMDPDHLRRTYDAMLGHPMPLKLLGFRNIMDMAKEMSDMVSINFGVNSSIILKAVSDESTKNIEQLVAKQRRSASKKKKKVNFSPCFPATSVMSPRRGCAPPALPAQLRAQLRALLSQGPLRLSDLEMRYLRHFGIPLRVRDFGFNSTRELLVAATDLFFIQQGQLGSMVNLREHMLPRPVLRPFNTHSRTGPIKPESLRTNKTACKGPDNRVLTPTESSEVPVTQSLPRRPTIETTSGPVGQESTAVRCQPEVEQEGEAELRQEGCLFQKSLLKLEEELQERILQNGVAGTISPELKEKLQQVVGGTSGGLSVHDLPEEYKRLFGEDLPLQQSGFVSVTELVGAMSDIFYLQPPEGDDTHHWIVRNIQNRDLHSVSGETGSVGGGGRSHYVSCGESPWEGEVEGDHDSILSVRQYSNTQEKLTEVHLSTPALPLDALQSQRLKRPTQRGAREFVEVLVEHVESPGYFYIRFSEGEEAQAMEDMMFEMRRSYTYPEVSERYRLPEQFVRTGQVCCVSPKGMWFYRVVIHQVISPTQVEVYFVDFGDIIVMHTDKLKFLKSCYSILPAQAVPSSLAGIKPTTGGWTTEARARFQTLSSDRTLVGCLHGYTGDTLQLYLCDTHTDEDIYIGNVLLSQGHATACSPLASAAVSPVSLYLGKGMVYLPDVDWPTVDTVDLSSLATLKIEEEEMPALELINDIEVSSYFQVEDDDMSTSEAPPTNPASPSCILLGLPDLIQTETISAHCKDDLECRLTSERQTTEEEKCEPEVTEPSVDRPPPPLRTLSLHTPDLEQIQDSPRGVPVLPLQLRNLFPLFGGCYFNLMHPS